LENHGSEDVAKGDAPAPSGIEWLLLRAKSHQGSGVLSAVAYIRRAETEGGIAASTGFDASHISQQAHIRDSATYQFLSAAKQARAFFKENRAS
jgi:hypothetical protein